MNRQCNSMYHILLLLIILTTVSPANMVFAEEAGDPKPPVITAGAAVLLDVRTGQVLFEKNSREKKPPASTTKVMTALLALEGGNLQQVVKVSPAAASVGEASLELRPGEELTLKELLYGALLRSGNDACFAIAEHIAGTEDNFVLLMNQKAKILGAENTSFKNTNGLPEAGHLTTARDLAIITRYALSNPVFQEIVKTRQKIIGNQWEHYLSNTNRLLWSYEWADGVKTGTTNEAGCCLIASATKDGRQLLSVVLNSENRWKDSIKLLDFGFESFKYYPVVFEQEAVERIPVREGTSIEITAVSSSDLGVVIPERQEAIETKVEVEKELYAPVHKGQRVGTITIYLQGKSAGSVDLVSDRDVERLPAYRLFWNKLWIA